MKTCIQTTWMCCLFNNFPASSHRLTPKIRRRWITKCIHRELRSTDKKDALIEIYFSRSNFLFEYLRRIQNIIRAHCSNVPPHFLSSTSANVAPIHDIFCKRCPSFQSTKYYAIREFLFFSTDDPTLF